MRLGICEYCRPTKRHESCPSTSKIVKVKTCNNLVIRPIDVLESRVADGVFTVMEYARDYLRRANAHNFPANDIIWARVGLEYQRQTKKGRMRGRGKKKNDSHV